VVESELQGGGASGSSSAEHEDCFAVEFEAELFAEGADEGVCVGVKAVGTDFCGRVREFGERTPLSARVFGFEADGVDGAPTPGGVVEGVDEVEGQEFVRDGEVESEEAHGFRAVDGGAEVVGGDIESEVTPIEFEGRQGGVMHGGRGGMFDGMSVHGAVARGGVNRRG